MTLAHWLIVWVVVSIGLAPLAGAFMGFNNRPARRLINLIPVQEI